MIPPADRGHPGAGRQGFSALRVAPPNGSAISLIFSGTLWRGVCGRLPFHGEGDAAASVGPNAVTSPVLSRDMILRLLVAFVDV